MTQKILFIDIDTLCGKDNFAEKKFARVVQNPTKNIISEAQAENINVVFLCWDEKSKKNTQQINEDFKANGVEISPAFPRKNCYGEDDKIEVLLKKYQSDAQHAYCIASNPTTMKEFQVHHINVTKVHISNPQALVDDSLREEKDFESREQFQLLKEKIRTFINS